MNAARAALPRFAFVIYFKRTPNTLRRGPMKTVEADASFLSYIRNCRSDSYLSFVV